MVAWGLPTYLTILREGRPSGLCGSGGVSSGGLPYIFFGLEHHALAIFAGVDAHYGADRHIDICGNTTETAVEEHRSRWRYSGP